MRKSINERIIFFGRNKDYNITLLCFRELLKAIKNSNHEIVLTVVSDDNHRRRNTLEELAKRDKIPFTSILENNVNDPKFLKKIKKLNPTIFVTVQFPKIYSEKLIMIPEKCCVNLHRGWPLRGGSIDERAIYHKLNRYYVILHHITPGIDDGNIIGRKSFQLGRKENGHSLVKKCDNVGRLVFKKYLIPYLGKKIPKGRKQNKQKTTYANKGILNNEIKFTEKAESIERLSRAFFHPRKNGAVIKTSKGEIILMPPIKILNKKRIESPGKIIRCDESGVKISTMDKIISINQCIHNGKKQKANKIFTQLNFDVGDSILLQT